MTVLIRSDEVVDRLVVADEFLDGRYQRLQRLPGLLLFDSF